MPYNLVLNNTNVIGSSNSIFQYRFINGAFNIDYDSELCVSQVVMPYSWFNISQTYYQNATLQYNWYYGAGLFTTHTIVFPDGFYTTSDLNHYIQLYMIGLNQYFTNTDTGVNLYYIEIITNATYYANQLILSNIPLTTPTGYSQPSGGFNSSNGGFPTGTSLTPQVIIASYTGSNSIGSIIGFTAGTYPPTSQSVPYNILSNATPNATPVNSVIVRCDLVSNECSMPSDILDTFSINASFGSNITYEPAYEKWISLKNGTYNQFTITFQDQNFRQLQANDSNVLIALILRQGKPRKIKEEIVNRTTLTDIKQINFKE